MLRSRGLETVDSADNDSDIDIHIRTWRLHNQL